MAFDAICTVNAIYTFYFIFVRSSHIFITFFKVSLIIKFHNHCRLNYLIEYVGYL